MPTRANPTEHRSLIDVRQAAAQVGRHPETIRRWIWSGRLRSERRGHRLMVVPKDVEELAGGTLRQLTLADWAALARSMRAGDASTWAPSAADLVLEDRAARATPGDHHAGR